MLESRSAFNGENRDLGGTEAADSESRNISADAKTINFMIFKRPRINFSDRTTYTTAHDVIPEKFETPVTFIDEEFI
jgi:hypothetical protein